MRRQFKYKPLSSDVLHWSQDNQLAFCTHDAIYIVTPSEKLSSTQILSQKFRPRRFLLANDHNNLDHIRSSQILTDSFINVCWSPTGLSSSGGCMLLSISAHHYIEVYAPLDDPRRGAWTKVLDLTKIIEELSVDAHKRLDQLQSTCTSWSYMLPDGNSSIVAIGDKSGRVLFLEISENQVKKSSRLQVSDAWISKCTWSDWKLQAGSTFSYFATAAADGSINIWKVSYLNGYLEFDMLHQVSGPDRLLVTAICFECDSEFPKLAFSKGYSVYTCSFKADIKLSTVRLPCFMNVCTIIWSGFDSSIRIYSSDGMCFILSHDKSGSLFIIDDDSNGFRSAIIKSDGNILEIEDGEEKPEEYDTREPENLMIYGAAASFNSLYDCILFKSFKKHDVNYITTVDESCTMLIRPLVDANDDLILEDVKNCFESPISMYLKSLRLEILNPYYNAWDINELLKSSHLSALVDIQSELYSKSREIMSQSTEDMHEIFQSNAFKNHKLASYFSLLREGKVDFLLYSESIFLYIKYFFFKVKKSGVVSRSNLETINIINSLYLQNSSDWADLLTELIKFYTFLSKDSSLASVAEGLLSSLKENDTSKIHQETCLACQSQIPVISSAEGSCVNGHDWSRCSFCLRCIQSFSYRECIGCKARACHDDVVDLKLCIICGCKFQLVGIGFC